MGHSIRKIFSKFGHSSEFRVFFLGKYREFSSEFAPWKCLLKIFFSLWPKFFSSLIFQSAPKERRRRRAEKRSSKRVFLESPFLLFPPSGLLLKHMKSLRGQRGNGLSKNTLLDDRFSARPLRRSFGAP